MANPDHLKILKQGVEAWNRWRDENAAVRPDLISTRLASTSLAGADLTSANLARATLANADLAGADLGAAFLFGADLTSANLANASFVGANLAEAVLAGADLTGVRLDSTRLAGTDFANARLFGAAIADVDLSESKGLETVEHLGRSTIATSTLERTAAELVNHASRQGQIEQFLRGAGVSETYLDAFKFSIGQPIQFYSCFISYSHDDKGLARRLHDQLQARGIRCWLDEHHLKPGDRILDVVDEAIRLHDKILLCCSKASLESWWVKDEIRKALERDRRDGRDVIIPLMVDRYLLDGWEDGLAADLRSRLAADFTAWEHDNAKFAHEFERVVKALRTDDGAHENPPEPKL